LKKKIFANNKPAESQAPSGFGRNQASEINTFAERLGIAASP
jgi:hypothetical protein